MLKKRKNLLLFTLVFLMTLSTPVSATNYKSIDEMASSLNILNILRGNGDDYNLEGQLKRSEAAAFIVRLLGVEKEVIADKAKYVKTEFLDVPQDEWYSHYIGYVSSKGIVNGFGNGNYKPDEYVSEKAFTKMVLGAMGYYQDKDFQWTNIYKFAYSKGLYKDDIYKTKLSDDLYYTRKGVVKILYNSLDKQVEDINKSIIQRLIDNGFTTKAKAEQTGLYKEDSIKTEIKSIKSVTNDKIKIVLTEEIIKFDKSNVVIIEEENSNKLNVKDILFNKNIITIITDKQIANKNYEISLLNITDKEGINTSEIKSNFVGFQQQEIISNFFKISKVEAVSKNIINVYFTHPINQSAGIPMYFDIKRGGEMYVDGSFSNLSAKVLGSVDNCVSLFLKEDDLAEGTDYSVVISGDLASNYGVKLNDGSGEEFGFIGNHDDNQTLQITNVEPIEKDYIMVTFNKDIDVSTATIPSNYELEDTDANIIMNSSLGASMAGEGADKYRKVKVRFINMKKDHNYLLKIKNIKDAYKQSYISEEIAPFYGYPDNAASLKIDYAYSEDKNTVKVYFNRNVPSNIVNATFVMNGVSFVSKQFLDIEPRVLTLYINSSTPLQNGTNYKLSIIGAKNEFGVPYTGSIEYTLQGTSTESGDIGITECKFIANDTVFIKFNKEINQSANNASKFKLEYTESDTTKTITASNINFIDSKTVSVKFSNIDMNTKYNVKISNLVNFSNQFTTREVSSSIEQ
ncbi:S-layer homology domain-containing protein [Vallitalea maricola]|uniref:Uncharacterized protein n=1 Tax=Vallitalea maricola TaxID=3074433 RepID=A0ACB5UE71_9FIRM|nr:hypothetical protein AN2V17_00800 [Vallitalea sp. AN17-2]